MPTLFKTFTHAPPPPLACSAKLPPTVDLGLPAPVLSGSRDDDDDDDDSGDGDGDGAFSLVMEDGGDLVGGLDDAAPAWLSDTVDPRAWAIRARRDSSSSTRKRSG